MRIARPNPMWSSAMAVKKTSTTPCTARAPPRAQGRPAFTAARRTDLRASAARPSPATKSSVAMRSCGRSVTRPESASRRAEGWSALMPTTRDTTTAAQKEMLPASLSTFDGNPAARRAGPSR
jgi:hypothetical protein